MRRAGERGAVSWPGGAKKFGFEERRKDTWRSTARTKVQDHTAAWVGGSVGSVGSRSGCDRPVAGLVVDAERDRAAPFDRIEPARHLDVARTGGLTERADDLRLRRLDEGLKGGAFLIRVERVVGGDAVGFLGHSVAQGVGAVGD